MKKNQQKEQVHTSAATDTTAGQHDNKRRAFLRGGAMLGAGAALAVTNTSVATPLTEQAEPAAPENATKKGYQLTDHVAAYYRNAAS